MALKIATDLRTIAPTAVQEWTVTGMAEYIELTEELILSMRAGARAISNTKKYHGAIYVLDVFSENPKEMPYLKAAEILYAASEKESEDVAPVRHGRWVYHNFDTICSECRKSAIFDEWEQQAETEFCPHCGAKMDEDVTDT